MRFDQINGKIKKYDFVEVTTSFDNIPGKYVVTSISRGIIKLAQIIEDDSASAVYPVVAMPISIISEIKKVGDHMLLFYSNLKNLHIENAILSKNNKRKKNAKI